MVLYILDKDNSFKLLVKVQNLVLEDKFGFGIQK